MKQLNNKTIERAILDTVGYFSKFQYSPDLNEIHAFIPIKTALKALKTAILELERKNKLIPIQKSKWYTLPEYSKYQLKIKNSKFKISEKKLKNRRFRAYLKLLGHFPQIKLIGLSGSISMMNADRDDDIDLFIISAKKRLFTARFIALLLAQILGLRRTRDKATRHPPSASRHANKVCLNLFFDESDLKVPAFKWGLYVGHEVLQMKPLINKSFTYERFLKANSWVFRLFPNAKSVFGVKYPVTGMGNREVSIRNTKYLIPDAVFDKIESFLKVLQLKLINRHKTLEIITYTQLWFHPEDFSRKI